MAEQKNGMTFWILPQTWRDYENLKEELTATEQNIEETMEQERVVEARISDRARRPNGEHTKDEVDRQLRDELARLRNFSKHLRDNHASISNLLALIDDSLARIDSCAADLLNVIHLDNDRITSRLGEPSKSIPQPPPTPADCPDGCQTQELSPRRPCQEELHVIKEEDERVDDDEDEPYPLDH